MKLNIFVRKVCITKQFSNQNYLYDKIVAKMKKKIFMGIVKT